MKQDLVQHPFSQRPWHLIYFETIWIILQRSPFKTKKNLSPLGEYILPLVQLLKQRLRTGKETESDECQSGIVWRRIGQTAWEAFLLACQVLSGPREEFGSSTVKIEGMNDARNQKWEEKSTAKSEQILTPLHCTSLTRFGYWVHFIVPARCTLWPRSQCPLYGSFWLLHLPLVVTRPSALATACLSLYRALLTHGPASVFKESEKQLLLLPALRHCRAAAP